MSWQERQYDCGGGQGPGGGGVRSWLGGMPRPGKAVKYILIANIVMFALCQFTGEPVKRVVDGPMGPITIRTGEWDSPIYQALTMRTDLVLKGQVWRLFTFTYLHDQFSFLHIIFNMLVLYLAGVPLERAWGSRRFFIFYTLSGFAAVSLYFVLSVLPWLARSANLVGASGGVLAVLGACAVLFPHMRVIVYFFPVPIRLFTLLYGIFFAYNLSTRGDNAGGDACHLAGLAFGIAWGYRGHVWMHKWGEWRSDIKRGAMETKQQDRLRVEDNADQVLDKVRREGMASLSRREKQILERATKMQQEEDRRHGL